MARFLVPASCLLGELTELPAEVAQQVARVLRLRPGAAITLFSGDGSETSAELAEVSPRRATARLLQRSTPDVELPVSLEVAVAVLKGEKLDWVVQKLTEIGVSRILLMQSDRTVVSAGEERWPRRLERFARIAAEAVEQSGRVRVPMIQEPRPLAACLEMADGRLGVILDPTSGDRLAEIAVTARPLRLFIGPEGGFTPHEVETAVGAGCFRAALGKRVLRAETAAITAAGIAAHVLDFASGT